MSTLNPAIAIIKNTTANTYHPIVFTESPLPGDTDIVRLRSKMHHSSGFPTKEEAITHIDTDLLQKVKDSLIGEPILDLETEFEWDGEGIPAMTVFLVNKKLVQI